MNYHWSAVPGRVAGLCAVGAASKVAQRDGRLVEMYRFVAVVYFVLCCALSWLVRQLQNRVAIVR